MACSTGTGARVRPDKCLGETRQVIRRDQTDAPARPAGRQAKSRSEIAGFRAIGYHGPAQSLRLRRIRLVAYGARLESVLGASPRGFESPILRHSRLTKHSGKFSGSISHFADVDEDVLTSSQGPGHRCNSSLYASAIILAN